MIRLQVFGSPGLLDPAGRDLAAVTQQPKRFALLVWLALASPHRFVRRDTLLSLFWPDLDDQRGRSALRQCLYFLRHQIGADIFLTRGDEEVMLAPGVIRSDAADFEDALGSKQLESALKLYQGDLLPGFFVAEAGEFERWLDGERRRLHDRAVESAWKLASAAAPGSEIAVTWARRAVELAPEDEAGVTRLVQMLAQRGDRTGAIRVYERFVNHLKVWLDLEPGAQLRALVEDIHGQAGKAGPGLPLTPTPQPARIPPLEKPRGALRFAIGLTAVVAAAVLFRAGRPRSPPVDSNLVAVAPFEILNPVPDSWRDGVPSLLAANLDGAGPLRAVPPSQVLWDLAPASDRESLRALAIRNGAAIALGGRVIPAGNDSIRLTAVLVESGADPVEFALGGSASRLDQLSDSLTVMVLRELGRSRAIAAVPLAAIGSRSWPALKAFLRGEQLYRAGTFDSAVPFYQRAIAEDTTFAPALRRLANVLSWTGTVYAESSQVYQLRAGRLNRGLAVRESLLILAESLTASLKDADRDPRWGSRRRRLDDVLAHGRTAYPRDPEMWYLYGEMLFHLGSPHSNRVTATLEAFDRAIALDSQFAPAYVHPVTLATQANDLVRARTYALRYLAKARGNTAVGLRWFLRTLEPGGDIWLDSLLLRPDLDPNELFEAWSPLHELADSAERAVSIFRRLASGKWPTDPFSHPEFLNAFLANSLIRRGHLQQALKQELDPAQFAELAWVGAVSTEAARSRFDEWLAGGTTTGHFALPWWARNRDTLRILTFLRRRAVTDLHQDDARRYDVAVGQAYLALARGDSSASLRALASLPDSLCPSCGFPRLTRVELLLALGRTGEAGSVLNDDLGWFTDETRLGGVLWEYYRGLAAAAGGNDSLARRHLGRVARLWRHADPELDPWVEEAARQLSLLQ